TEVSRAWRTARASMAGGGEDAKGGLSRPSNPQPRGVVRSHRILVIAPQQPGELALNLHLIRPINLRIVGTVGGIEPNHAVLTAQVLERRFLVADQRHDDLAVAR